MKPLLDKLIAACHAVAANQCRLLQSGVQGGRESSASMRVRVKRAGVERLVSLAATVGELASVQSELDAESGVEARLMERVNMDLLNIAIQSRTQRGFWSPVKRAVGDFGSNLSEGIASAVTGVAYLIPWALILLAIGALVRKLWRRARNK